MIRRHICLIALLTLAGPVPSLAMDHVLLQRDGKQRTLSGEIVVKAQDGGLLFRSQDGTLWTIQPREIAKQASDERPFQALDKQALSAQLQQELGEQFSVHDTANYVVCYDTTSAYAQWCGALYERLFRGFYAYWKGRGAELKPPDGPLAAIVFSSRQAFAAYAKRDLETDPGGMIGYYNVRTNRVVMYDLTGVDGRVSGRVRSAAHINQILMQPQAERTVATIVHEATHQLAYNSGLQTRYADNPFWISEGLAVFFETPDLRSKTGWRGIGQVNRLNLARFRKFSQTRSSDSLHQLLSDDARFRKAETAGNAYAEAWALNYFLLRRHRQKYVAFLAKLAARTPLIELSGEERRQEFAAAFGSLDELDREFVRYLRSVR